MHEVSRRPRGAHVLALAVTLAAALTVVFVAPAGAGTSHNAAAGAYCGGSMPAEFGSLALLAGSSAARGAGNELREPSLSQTVEELPASAKGKGGKAFRATVPVYFHVVHAGGVGNIAQTVIDEQMNVLNAAFAGFYGGAYTGFKFRLSGVSRTDNAAWHFAGPGTSEERAMKQTLHQGGWNALNLYATTAGAYLGWAYFPGLPQSRQYLDGIVVDWESMPGTSSRYAGRFDLGHTATHEVGHWVHLHHVFNGGCNNWGDYVDDTPPQLIATSRCPIGQDSCREPGLDSIHNYMDYSDDPCYNQFTAGQVTRMQDAWLYYRAAG
ncbi:MAG: zinc metalloprotease [Actinomycetota bacterium]|nr:zinc metalloprotease [Actinomycetota bacterium]